MPQRYGDAVLFYLNKVLFPYQCPLPKKFYVAIQVF